MDVIAVLGHEQLATLKPQTRVYHSYCYIILVGNMPRQLRYNNQYLIEVPLTTLKCAGDRVILEASTHNV